MDIGKSFSFVFEDERWTTKLLIGGAITAGGMLLLMFSVLIIGLVGIVPLLIVFGYTVRVMRNVMAGEVRPMPEWADLGVTWSNYLKEGFNVAVVMVVYMVPAIVLNILSPVLSEVRNLEVLGILFGCVAFLYSIAVGLVIPAAVGEYLASNSISAALQFTNIWAIVQRNMSDFVVVLLLGFVASILGSAGVIACVIGLPFTFFYAALVRAHLWAQVYQKARGGGGQAVLETTPL